MEEGHLFVMKPASAWARQAEEALDRIEQANGGRLPPRIAEAVNIDREAFGSLIEALVALAPLTGRPVGQDLIDLAGLRPADEVLLWIFMPSALTDRHKAAYQWTGSIQER